MFFRFHVECNAAQTSFFRITQKRETSQSEAIVLWFGATVEQRENGIRVHSGGFLKTWAWHIAVPEYTAFPPQTLPDPDPLHETHSGLD